MKIKSFSLFVRRPTWNGWICAFRMLCVATVLMPSFSGLGLAQDVPAATITGSGTADFIPIWTGPTTIGNSAIFQTVGGKVGIGTTTPGAKLDVKGAFNIHGSGFSIDPTGKVHFVAGQGFPGTIAGVIAGTDLTGGGTSGKVTLNLDTTKIPQLGTANTFTGNQSVTGNVTATGQVQGAVVNATASFDIGGNPFAFAGASGTTFLGFAGNATTTGTDDTGAGAGALGSNTTGSGDVAFGQGALVSNTSGNDNTADGTNALFSNTTGAENTAVGADALSGSNGTDLTCVGFDCTASGHKLHNATAIGAHAMVKVSNALVLGSVAGVNGATATARIGIGTTSPTNLLTLGQGAGPSIADGWATYSSRRWKTNIQPLQNALGLVEQLRGVSYDLKDSGKHEIGVIAEEVGAVVPEVVSYEDNGKDARGVDYSRLTALLIEAIKVQQAQIQAERTRGDAQQARIARLTSQMRAIRTSLQASSRVGHQVREVKTQANLLPGRGVQ
jgi:hypothetical protein